ncbi:MAG: hypothetical protein R3B51_04660 [Thermodesulfobacteriota bacterium]
MLNPMIIQRDHPDDEMLHILGLAVSPYIKHVVEGDEPELDADYENDKPATAGGKTGFRRFMNIDMTISTAPANIVIANTAGAPGLHGEHAWGEIHSRIDRRGEITGAHGPFQSDCRIVAMPIAIIAMLIESAVTLGGTSPYSDIRTM